MKMDGYMSPISLSVERIVQDFNEHTDRNVLHAVMQCGINVDRDELIKALSYDRDQYRKGFNDGYEFAQTWISVKDRLPEYNVPVLVFDQLENMHVYQLDNDALYGDTWVDYYDQNIKVNWITHWVPLPEPPKEE